MVIASERDGIYFDRSKSTDASPPVVADLNHLYQVMCIKAIEYDAEEQQFYILCNKKFEKLGFFIIKFDQCEPLDFTDMTRWKHSLDIDDANLQVLRHQHTESGEAFKELIVSFKTIYQNIYSVYVLDISDSGNQRTILFKHDRFQLWESEIRGLLLPKNKDFVTVSKAGIDVLALGQQQKRQL